MKNKDVKLNNGDCLELMKDIPDKSIDLILCDLPYGVTARNKWDSVIDLDKLWEHYNRIIKDTGAIILFGQGMFTAKLMLSNPDMWRYNLIWEKTQPTGFLNAKRMPLRNHEDICVFYKKLPTFNPQKSLGHVKKISTAEHKRNGKLTTDYSEYNLVDYSSSERYPVSVVKIPEERDSIITFAKDTQKEAYHPTQKPVALCEYLIRSFSNEGDVVLDNCMGSGTTGVACINTGRTFIGIERDTEIFEIAKNRIEGNVAPRKLKDAVNSDFCFSLFDQ